ncbi:MAG: hypothetical protein IMF19_04530 [Proteobacteria bacterium]|nr:hypothetical protein [Pseudomonadota bacterium]
MDDSVMKITLILKIVGILYSHGLRDLLIKFINDPNNKWDEKLVMALDSFFSYTSKNVKN